MVPEKVVTGRLFDRLVRDLTEANVLLDMTTEKVEALKS